MGGDSGDIERWGRTTRGLRLSLGQLGWKGKKGGEETEGAMSVEEEMESTESTGVR